MTTKADNVVIRRAVWHRKRGHSYKVISEKINKEFGVSYTKGWAAKHTKHVKPIRKGADSVADIREPAGTVNRGGRPVKSDPGVKVSVKFSSEEYEALQARTEGGIIPVATVIRVLVSKGLSRKGGR